MIFQTSFVDVRVQVHWLVYINILQWYKDRIIRSLSSKTIPTSQFSLPVLRHWIQSWQLHFYLHVKHWSDYLIFNSQAYHYKSLSVEVSKEKLPVLLAIWLLRAGTILALSFFLFSRNMDGIGQSPSNILYFLLTYSFSTVNAYSQCVTNSPRYSLQ